LNRLRLAAIVAFCLHLVAGLAMMVVLRHGLETNPDLRGRLTFLATHRTLWSFAWLTWTAAALSILYFYMTFAETHDTAGSSRVPLRLAVLLTTAALAPDLAAQAIEIGVLPPLAFHALSSMDRLDLFLVLHRTAVMLSGYLANGLYSLSALFLAWSTRPQYSAWVWLSGLAAGFSGFLLSAAALMDSTAGMFWSNVVLVPSILLWLAGVGANWPKMVSDQVRAQIKV